MLLAGLAGLVAAGLVDAPAGRADDEKKAALAVDADVAEFLAAWATTMREVRTLRVRFRQEKSLRILKKPRVSRGTAILHGKRLLMTIENEAGDRELALLIADGEARIHHPRLARVEVFPIGDAEGGEARPRMPTPFPMFGEDVEALPETYAISLERGKDEGDGPTDDRIILIPHDAASAIERLELTLRDYRVTGLVQRGRRGDEVRISIEEFAINADVEEGEVALDLPEGTRVIRVLGGAADGD